MVKLDYFVPISDGQILLIGHKKLGGKSGEKGVGIRRSSSSWEINQFQVESFSYRSHLYTPLDETNFVSLPDLGF